MDEFITVGNQSWKKEAVPMFYKDMQQIIEDVNGVAEFATLTAMDKDELAEMLVYALHKIDELEAKLNG